MFDSGERFMISHRRMWCASVYQSLLRLARNVIVKSKTVWMVWSKKTCSISLLMLKFYTILNGTTNHHWHPCSQAGCPQGVQPHAVGRSVNQCRSEYHWCRTCLLSYLLCGACSRPQLHRPPPRRHAKPLLTSAGPRGPCSSSTLLSGFFFFKLLQDPSAWTRQNRSKNAHGTILIAIFKWHAHDANFKKKCG